MALYILFAISLVAQLSNAQIQITEEIPTEEPALFNQLLNSTAVHPVTEDKISHSYKWERVLWPSNRLPTDAVLGGADSPNGCGMVYVGRALYQGNLLPGKICGSDGRAFVAYNGTEIMLNKSEVLRTQNILWKPIKEGEIPANALQAGKTENGEKLYIGRGFVGTLLTPGKVGASSKTLYMTYDQKVYTTLRYEILILD